MLSDAAMDQRNIGQEDESPDISGPSPQRDGVEARLTRPRAAEKLSHNVNAAQLLSRADPGPLEPIRTEFRLARDGAASAKSRTLTKAMS